jgi:hypothetical protein
MRMKYNYINKILKEKDSSLELFYIYNNRLKSSLKSYIILNTNILAKVDSLAIKNANKTKIIIITNKITIIATKKTIDLKNLLESKEI